MLARGRQGKTTSSARPSSRRWRVFVVLAAMTCLLAGPAVTVALAAPEYVLPPEVSGKAQLGERLTCYSGEWKGSPKFQYEWVREGVEFYSNSTYTLKPEDEHKEIWCIVTATESGQESRAESNNGICLGGSCGEPPIPVENKRRPEVSPPGTTTVGQTLTCSQGEWTGRPTPTTFLYRWLRDNEEIPSATSNAYIVKAEDETHALSCRVTASNGDSEAKAESSNSVKVPGSPPKSTKLPEVLGVPSVNETLTCSEGTWSGSKPLTFEFSWYRNGTKISTGNTRIVEPADEGQSLSCRVVATNKQGKAEAASAEVKVEGKLAATEPPTISGTPEEGQTLTCSAGGWNEPVGQLTLKYQWLRDNETILGATSSQHKVENADRGHLLYCQLTARNARSEEAHATSAPVGVKKGPGVPVNTGLPALEGSLSLGSTVTCNKGAWTNSPTQYVFQWLRDNAAIEGARASTYKVTAADQGHALTCKVIAENSEGPSEPEESAPGNVQGEVPEATSPPEVYAASMPPRVGESLTCLRGEWKGAPKPTFAYKWLRDGATNVGSSAAYTVANGDRGHTLSCRVTATNSEAPGGVSAISNIVTIPGVAPEPPIAGPTISGEPSVGSTLECLPGTWGGAPQPIFTFQWLLNGTAIPSAIQATFTVGSADRGFALSCRVTATNKEGTASALSSSVHVAGVRPTPEELPFISGTGAVGQTLKCERGIWSGKPPPSFTYQWYRDGAAIAGATESAYTIEPGDQGHSLSCSVTGSNSEGGVEVEARNRVAVASHVTQTPVETPVTGGKTPGPPSPSAILASLSYQLKTAFRAAHIKAIMKTRNFGFSFIAPAAGTFEVLWYVLVKAAHGGRSKQLVLAQSTVSFTGAKRGTVRLKLTANGIRLLKNKKRISLKAKAMFTIPHQKPVIWTGTLVLTL
jgi:hypothetical protein